MSRNLIINADDFGLTPGVNRAVAELAARGAITSATLMANAAAFSDAVGIAKATPALGIGCHIVLTDGTPVSPPASIPTLIGHDNRNFRSSLKDFWVAVLLGKVDPADVEREAEAQIAELQRAGISVTHIDTHKHTHMLLPIARSLLSIAEKLGIRAVRNPFEQPWSLKESGGNWQRAMQVRVLSALRKRFEALPQIQSGAVLTSDGTIGISATGKLDAHVLRAVLQKMPDGVWELVCHPGYNDQDLDAIPTRLRATREIEREALLQVFTETSSHPLPLNLIHYGMLPLSHEPNAPQDSGGNVPSGERSVLHS